MIECSNIHDLDEVIMWYASSCISHQDDWMNKLFNQDNIDEHDPQVLGIRMLGMDI